MTGIDAKGSWNPASRSPSARSPTTPGCPAWARRLHIELQDGCGLEPDG
ncbi:MAG: hypothetical protein U1A78_01500 [Polyangia bacterium]